MGSKGLVLPWSPEDEGLVGWRRLALFLFPFPSQALIATAALTSPALICGQFLCQGCGHTLPDTLWGLDLLLAAASSATSQQFPLFVPCRAGKFLPLCHLSGCHLTASAFVPYSHICPLQLLQSCCQSGWACGSGESRELQLPGLLLSSLDYLAINSPSSSSSCSSSITCCSRLPGC